MKVSIYAISRNEEKFVDRFLSTILPELRDGDNITILDTGSVDRTVERFRGYDRVNVFQAVFSPFRFDDARNVCLSLVPGDIDVAISIDVDEVIQPGWRDNLDMVWTHNTTRLQYPFVWSWKDDGTPAIQFYSDKIHSRHGYRWNLPAHEILEFKSGNQVFSRTDLIAIHHHPDASKSRSNYINLLEVGYKENPTNSRSQYYYARELYFVGRQPEASEVFQKYLDNPASVWRHERSEAMIYLSKMNGNTMWKNKWAYIAASECPERREVWWNLYDREIDNGNFSLAEEFKKRAEETPVDMTYLSSGR
jgi:glycosyltransferase involved in cell wall biosynthesis